MGLIFNFQRKIVTWDNLSIPMRPRGSISPPDLNTIDPQDAEAPEIVQKAVH